MSQNPMFPKTLFVCPNEADQYTHVGHASIDEAVINTNPDEAQWVAEYRLVRVIGECICVERAEVVRPAAAPTKAPTKRKATR